jgi:hypothetical protein
MGFESKCIDIGKYAEIFEDAIVNMHCEFLITKNGYWKVKECTKKMDIKVYI